jgi:hypothetical protein
MGPRAHTGFTISKIQGNLDRFFTVRVLFICFSFNWLWVVGKVKYSIHSDGTSRTFQESEHVEAFFAYSIETEVRISLCLNQDIVQPELKANLAGKGSEMQNEAVYTAACVKVYVCKRRRVTGGGNG